MKKKILNYIQVNIIPFIASIFMRLLYMSNKRVFHFPADLPKNGFILAFWHGDLLMMPQTYKKLKPYSKITGVISDHRDGETIKRIFEYFHVDSVRGSSTRGGAKALIAAISVLKKGGDIAITPDGPRGPRHSVASGIVAMAHKTDAKILSFSVKPSRYWQLKSWDKFIIPKPFGTIHFYVSEPFDIKGLNEEEAKLKIKSNMMKNLANDLH